MAPELNVVVKNRITAKKFTCSKVRHKKHFSVNRCTLAAGAFSLFYCLPVGLTVLAVVWVVPIEQVEHFLGFLYDFRYLQQA